MSISVVAALLGAALPIGARAQAPDWYNWHDRVDPTVSVEVSLDEATGDFLYGYTVSNGPTAEQRIASLTLELAVTPSGIASPTDWRGSFDPSTPVVGWWAEGPEDPAWESTHELDIPSTLSEIGAGATLSGFSIRSPCAASGDVVFYARGYNHISVRPADDASEWVQTPDWRDDAVAGAVTGPGDCGTVADWGNRRPAVDGFVGLVNFADGAALPSSPVTVQLRFSRSGESVDRASLRVELNRVDVTAAFRTNSLGDAVAIFSGPGSPIEPGRNVLLVQVDGVVPGTTRSATDADRFTFTVP